MNNIQVFWVRFILHHLYRSNENYLDAGSFIIPENTGVPLSSET